MKLPALLFACLLPFSAHGALRAGFAERDITPEIGMEVPGGYGKSYSKRIHDPCKARTAVFDDGKKKVVLVGLDALVVPRSLVLGARERITQRCGIPGEAVLIGASHSHSSGPIGMVQPGEYDHASEVVKDLAYHKSSGANPAYLDKVRDAIVDAVVAAHDGRAELAASFGSGREDQVAFNRRIRMKNGLAYSHPRPGNPDSVAYAGPTDPEVGVIGVWNPDGALVGCVVNFSCHATASGPWVSANWIYYMEKVIQGYYGKDTKVVFLQGACGDVTQVDNFNPHANPDSDAWSQWVGGRVGAEAVKVLLGMSQTRVSEVPVDFRARLWEIPRRKPAPARVQAARELIEKNETKNPDWVWAKETLMLDALLAKWPKVECEGQAIQIGPVVCLSSPAEYFVQYGLEWKRGSGFPMTFPCELANGIVGYVPTLEAFDPKTGGGYETRLTSYSNLEITAGDQIRDTGLALARQLTAMPLPQRPPAPRFNDTGWLYGNQPPQRE
jgi:hypothetical protein